MKRLFVAVIIIRALLLGLATPTSSSVVSIGKDIVYVYDGIEHDATHFILMTSKVKSYRIIISTPGGSAGEVVVIMQHMKRMKEAGAVFITESSGLCSSGGSFIWSMGNERRVHESDVFMFHEGIMIDPDTGMQIANSEIPLDYLEQLKKINAYFRQTLLDIFKDADIVNKLLNPEGNSEDDTCNNCNFFSGEEIFNMGIAHIIYR
jgi:ATP-dependent protease ClpP protease subunit